MKKKKDHLEYKQDDGIVLKGFSQVDLDDLNALLIKNSFFVQDNTEAIIGNRRWLWAIFALGLIFLMYLLFMTGYIIVNDVVNNVVGACL